MQNIQMVDLQGQYQKIKSEIDEAVLTALSQSQYINGPQVATFSNELKAYTKSNFVVPCGNGTDALQIALMALGLEQGDEVIVPVHTYVATAEVIALLKLKPVFIDANEDSFNLDITALEDKITARTKAIVPVHLYGQCADMEPILSIAKKHGLFVIEDNAQAIGAEYTFSNGKKHFAGTIGDIGTTSFYPSKNLGAYGDGGAIFIQEEEVAKLAAMIANHGQAVRYYHDVVGCNSRLDTIQAAILSVKLKYLNEFIMARQAVAEKYDMAFKNVEGLQIPFRSPNSTHVFHQYTLKLDERINRDYFKEDLQKLGIPSMIYYPVPLHNQIAYYNPNFPMGSFPVSEMLSKTIISLPIHTEMQQEQLDYIIDSVKGLLSKQ
jgi:UDP-2-acetamido-2-deoxy-ribo-hexuluronate aminotransferase